MVLFIRKTSAVFAIFLSAYVNYVRCGGSPFIIIIIIIHEFYRDTSQVLKQNFRAAIVLTIRFRRLYL